MKILFQGDSITDGNRGRTDDPNHIMGHGFAFSIASRLGAKYPAKFEFINKGNSGDDVLKLFARWRLDAVLLKPDLVSILIGTNDINIENPPSRFETIYRMLLDDLPDSRFILCEPFRFRNNEDDRLWKKRSDLLEKYQQAVRRIAADYHAVFVPLQNIFEEAFQRVSQSYWIWDGVHPTVAGHELITMAWLRAIEDILVKDRK